jgi:pimeloyl-ACP methyl ester carboxylesterase
MKQVFIIHGWTYNLDKWSKLAYALKAKDIEPVFLRVPGLTEPSDRVWDIDGYIDWLDQQLKGAEKPTVVGHSNGGRIALAYINRYPTRISRLILIDSAGVAHNHKKAAAKLKTLKYIAKVGKPLAKLPGARKAFYKTIGARDYYEAPPNMRLTMRNMLAADQRMDFGSIKLPVDIIWGSDDSITPLSDGQAMARLINGAKLHIVENARHAPFFSDPETVAGIILKVVGK